MLNPKVIVLTGYGINCEEETKFAFELAGALADIVHIDDLIDGYYKFNKYQVIALPGGFSYGDDTGSGNAYALKLKNHLWEKILKFINQDKLVIGICNGFQILANLGLVPALNRKYGVREVALLHNDSARLIDRWVDLKIINNTPWFSGIKTLSVPIAHGEGKFFAARKILTKIKQENLIAAKYFKGEVCDYQYLDADPNGALEDIAAITDTTGRILGLMPHPERALFFNQLPQWPYLKEKYLREKKKLPKYGPGLQVFKNAVKYFNS